MIHLPKIIEDVIANIFANLSTEALQKTGALIVRKIEPGDKSQINHDL